MKTERKIGRERSKARGAAAVEFAILLPLLVMLLGGVIEFGRVVWYLDVLTKATRDGARYLSTAAAPYSTADRTVARNIVKAATDAAGLPGFDATANVSISCEPQANADCSALTPPDYVAVSISGYSVAFGSWFAMPIPVGNWPLSPHTTMRYMCTESGKSC